MAQQNIVAGVAHWIWPFLFQAAADVASAARQKAHQKVRWIDNLSREGRSRVRCADAPHEVTRASVTRSFLFRPCHAKALGNTVPETRNPRSRNSRASSRAARAIVRTALHRPIGLPKKVPFECSPRASRWAWGLGWLVLVDRGAPTPPPSWVPALGPIKSKLKEPSSREPRCAGSPPRAALFPGRRTDRCSRVCEANRETRTAVAF